MLLKEVCAAVRVVEGGMMRETVGGSEGQRKGHRPCNIRRTLP